MLSSIPTYFLTALKEPKGVLQAPDRSRRCFLWIGHEDISGGKCKVIWEMVCRPTRLGGLGVVNLLKFASTLRLRWLWQEWKALQKPWVGMELPCDDADRRLFAAATTITLGDGNKAKFWSSVWLDGAAPKDLAPHIFQVSRRKNLTVSAAL